MDDLTKRQTAARLLRQWIKRTGLTHQKFWGQLQTQDYEYDEEDLTRWARPGRKNSRFARDWACLAAAVQLLADPKRPAAQRPTPTEIQEFLHAVEFPHNEMYRLGALPGVNAPDPMPAQPSPLDSIPVKLGLIGREKELHLLATALCATPHRLVAIDGMGGLGKTRLLQALITYSQQQQAFEHIVALSAPTHVTDQSDTTWGFESVLNELGRALGSAEFARQPLRDKELQARQWLQQQRLLLVLDNLEVLGAQQEALLQRLLPLLGASKLLAASRRRFMGEGHIYHLEGLSTAASTELLQQQTQAKQLLPPPPELCAEMIQVTGGSPLALQLVVSQLAYLPPEKVLQHVREARPLRAGDAEDEYVLFYRQLFQTAWQLLPEAACCLLLNLAMFPARESSPTPGATWAELQGLAAEIKDFDASLNWLWKLSLVEVEQGVPHQDRHYYLHALTQNFVLSDIVLLPPAR